MEKSWKLEKGKVIKTLKSQNVKIGEMRNRNSEMRSRN